MKNDKQEKEWVLIYRDIKRMLEPYGKEDAFGKGDYLLVDDNWGNHQQKLEVQNLNLIRPRIVELLQSILAPYPDWEIVIGIDAPERKAGWPPMGLTVRSHEIIDGLQRQYLPAEFQTLKYKGSRVGTDRD
jgi:hypothetical protein